LCIVDIDGMVNAACKKPADSSRTAVYFDASIATALGAKTTTIGSATGAAARVQPLPIDGDGALQ